MDLSSHQIVDDEIGEEHGEEILLFGRALEFINIDLVSQHQLSLPLFLSDETAR
jgi:hypothetical protein